MNHIFEVGEKVMVKNTWNTYIARIDKVTPTGRIKVKGMTFKSNGYESGGDRWHPYVIYPLTPDEEQEYYDNLFIKQVVKSLQKLTGEEINIEQACQINKILNLNIEIDKCD